MAWSGVYRHVPPRRPVRLLEFLHDRLDDRRPLPDPRVVPGMSLFEFVDEAFPQIVVLG